MVDTDTLYNTPGAATPALESYWIWNRHPIRTNGTLGGNTICPQGVFLRSFKIIDNTTDNVVFDAIPVRVGTVGYLYDQVSGSLLGGADGDLVPGNDVI